MKNRLTKNSLFVVTRQWVGHQSCYSSKVLPRVANIETAFEITKKELVQSQIAEQQCISFYGIFQTFRAYYYCLHSSFSQSFSGLIFEGMKWKCSWISVIGTYFFQGYKGVFFLISRKPFLFRYLTAEIFQPIFGTSKTFFRNISSGLQLYYKETPKRVFSVKFVFFVKFLRRAFLWTLLLAVSRYYFGFQVSVWYIFIFLKQFQGEAWSIYLSVLYIYDYIMCKL